MTCLCLPGNTARNIGTDRARLNFAPDTTDGILIQTDDLRSPALTGVGGAAKKKDGPLWAVLIVAGLYRSCC
jgi:hypothetical protein